jgi:hypothetical protein
LGQLKLPNFLKPSQAKVPIQIFDECPHDRIPLVYVRELGPVLFRERFAKPTKWLREIATVEKASERTTEKARVPPAARAGQGGVSEIKFPITNFPVEPTA